MLYQTLSNFLFIQFISSSLLNCLYVIIYINTILKHQFHGRPAAARYGPDARGPRHGMPVCCVGLAR
jgi:hypothetical protein